MDRLLTVADMMERYQCSAPTARKLMRQMVHMEISGLKVRLGDVLAWEQERTVIPGTKKAPARGRRIRPIDDGLIPYRRA